MEQPRYWLIGASSDVIERSVELEDRKPPALIVDHDRDAHLRDLEARRSQRVANVAGVLGPIDPSTWVPMTLTIKDDSFAPDFMSQRAWFVSRRLREVMALPGHVAQYLPVDSSACHSAAREQDYRVMDAFAVQDAIDPEGSEIVYTDYPETDGTVSRQVLYVKTIVWREDFVSTVPIFRDPRDQRFFATDAFAAKVLQAGIADMVFQDVSSERAQSEVIYKSL
jgi:hypothetical protein